MARDFSFEMRPEAMITSCHTRAAPFIKDPREGLFVSQVPDLVNPAQVGCLKAK